MANIDDIIRKNKQYLTQAQIDALVAASKNYNMQNAGNRAGALATAREQYDTGYRGLQNMGLAGNQGAAPLSGEVPRLQQQIQTPFDDYNQRLKDVEHQRLGALGASMAQQTKAAWAAEAERRRQEEEARRRAAEQRQAYIEDQQRYQRAQAAVNAINRNRVGGISQMTAADLAVPLRKEYETSDLQRAAQKTASSAASEADQKYQQDGMKRTARPQDIAAAAAFNIAHYTSQPAVEAANAAQERGIRQTEQLKGATDASNANKYFSTGAGVQTQQDINNQYDAAKRELEGLKLKRHYGGSVSDDELQAAEGKVAALTLNSSTATPEEKKRASVVMADRTVSAMGLTKTMSDKDFNDAQKSIPAIKRQLNIIDSLRETQKQKKSTGTTGADYEQQFIDEAIDELKKMGYTEEEARLFASTFDNERYVRRDYNYFNDAYRALYEHSGEKPTQPLNSKEMNPTYWAVNGNVDPENKTYRNIGTSKTKGVAMLVEQFMTQEQRDAYNSIYEKEGIKAANAYAKAIKPFLEIQAAEADKKFFEEFASDENWLKRFQAWSLVRGTNLLGSIPAMLEKYGVNRINMYSDAFSGGTNIPLKYSPDSNISRPSNWADIVQTKQAQNILEKHGEGFTGKALNFMYNTGTSMADSLIAMAVAGGAGEWATDALFFSSAGNQTYKDAIARGGTQDQAMALAFLSGAAESFFEHFSLEQMTQTLKFKGKPLTQAFKDSLVQAGVEGSEELFTEIANVVSDWAVMKDKSEVQEAVKNGDLGRYLWDHLSSATLGGLASGLGFGIFGIGGTAFRGAIDSKSKNDIGTRVRENGDVQQVKNAAVMLGGEAMRQAESVQKKETDATVGEMTATVVNEIQTFGKELSQDQQVGLTRVLDGAEMTTQEASDVHELLGKETLERMNYDAATPEAFQKSYNDRVQKYGVTSRAEAMQQAAEKRFNKQKKEAASRVWANPEQGLSLTTPEGGAVRPMPVNMTAVALAEQERTGFKTRASAVKGNVTYAVAGMEARQGLSNERTYAEIQKGLTKEARKKAQIYEKLADALGVKMVIHDVMVGTNGFIDEKGNMHVVLSGKQSVLRVAAHELTHFMKEHAGTEYASMREYLIGEVGQAKFDKLVKQKAKEYGLNLDTEKGRTVADDEVCAELCERMLSNEDSLTRFAEKDTKAAKTLKAHLLEILNAIKSAFKQAENRDFGASKSELIESQETLESWITGLQKAIENADTKAETAADEARAKQFQANEELYITEEDAKASRAQAKLQSEVEADLKRGTAVSGYDTDTINGIIRSTLDTVGGETFLSKDALKQARARIAQTVRTAEAFLLDTENDAKQQALNDRTRQVATEIVDAYQATEGENAGALAELKDFLIGSDKTLVIGIGPNQMADIRSQYESPMVLQGKLAKALGARVQLVSKTNAKYESAWKMDELYEQLREKYNLSDDQSFTRDAQNLVDFIDGIRQQDEGVTAGIGDSETREQAILDVQQALMHQVLKAAGAKTSVEFSLDTDYMRLAEKQKAGTLTKEDESKLRKMVDEAARSAGYTPVTRYHQTRELFNTFNTDNPVAGLYDSETPNGIFLKTNDHDIGIGGSIQMPLYLSGKNLLHFANREQANAWYSKNVPGYAELQSEMKKELNKFDKQLNDIEDKMFAVSTTEEEYDALDKEWNQKLEAMKPVENEYRGKLRGLLNDYFLNGNSGYDGIELDYDGHRWVDGKRENVHTLIAFSPSQVKSADPVTYDKDGNIIPLSERFNPEKEDIRYDLDTELLEEIQQPEEDIVTRYSLDTQGKRRSGGGNATPLPKKLPVDGSKKPGYKQQGKEPRVRDVQVPERAKTGDRVSDFVRSFLESDKASDEIVAELQEKIENGDWGSYTQLSNEKAMDRAKNYIAKKQFVEAQQDFHSMVASGKYNVHTRALGLQLLTEAANRGDKAAVLDIAADLRVISTDAGQSLQIFSVMKELGGVGAAWYMQKEIDRLNTQYADDIASGKMDEITVTPELMQQLAEATTQTEIEAAEDAIAEHIAAQLPLTTKSKIVNWRYMSMLANPTTHFRNLTGNVFMAGLNAAKDVVATGIERAAVKDQSERAHAILNKKDRQMWKDIAAQSFQEQEKNLRGSGKNGFGSFIQQHMRSFDNKVLNAIAQGSKNGKNVLTRNGVMGMLEVEDVWFLRPAYQNAFMQYMKAQGFTVQDGKVGKMNNGVFTEITTAEMSKAVDWASQQAWKATFRDASTVASLLNNASQKLGPVGHVLIEGLMPFKKTPINIAKRGIEYSPAGIVIGTVQMMRDVKNGKMTAAQAIDNLSSGVVGTSLMVLGMALAKAGLIRAGGEDKKKQETYLQDTGDQTYSIKLGGVTLGVSALAPAAIPLLMGAALYDALDKSGEGVDLSSIAETIAGTLDPFMEMSVVSSLNSALKNYNQNGIGGALGNTIMTTLESYGAQFLPTFTGKIGQFIDPTVRTTKSSATSKVGSGLDYYGRSLAKKVPGLEATLEPDINVWGRKTQKTSFADWALDFANKFILPMNVRISNRDAVDDELMRLVESTGNVNILPSDGSKKFTVKGESYPMTAKQYTDYSIDRGQASYAAIKEVMNSKAYQNANDTEKADMIENALKAAQKQVDNMWKERLGAIETTTAKEETVKTMKGDYSDPALYAVAAQYPNAYDKAAKAKANGVSPDTFLDLYDKKESYIGGDRSNYMRQQIMSSNLTKQQKELMDDLIVSDKGQNPDYSSQAWFDVSMLGKTNYEKAKKGEKLGITPETYLAAYKKNKEISAAKLGNDKKSTVTKYLDSLKLSASAYDYLMANIFGYTR